MKNTFTRSIGCLIFFVGLFPASAQPVLNYTSKVTGLDFPVDLVNAGDGSSRLFIVEQAGLIKVYNGTSTSTFLDLTGIVTFTGDERGLLSMAFHPDYNGTTNRYFFVYYTTTSGGITTDRVARYQTQVGNPNAVDPASAVPVIAINKPANQTNHNGAKLNFGSDGMLYFATGDGGSGNDPFNLAQDGNSLLGKMLRIDINGTDSGFYSIPSDNPYFGNDGIKDAIWAIGLRNPFRWSFDPVTNAMWIGDVGQDQREEVDVRFPSPTTGGINYGWRCYEGNLQPPPGITACNPLPSNYVPPIYTYPHNSSTGGFAITGGYVYRGTANPDLYGYYVFADYVSGNVWIMTQGGTVRQQTVDHSNIAGFGVNEAGDLYAVVRGTSSGAGSIDSVGGNFPLPVTLVNFTVRNLGNNNELRWSTAYEQNADRYLIEYSFDGSTFTVVGEITAMNSTSGYNYTYRHAITDTRKIFYKLKMLDIDGSSRYSSVITVGGKNTGNVTIYPTVLQNRKLELNANTPVENLKLYDAGGKEIYFNNLHGGQGYFSIQLPNLAKGMYFVNIRGDNYNKTEKIIIQ